MGVAAGEAAPLGRADDLLFVGAEDLQRRAVGGLDLALRVVDHDPRGDRGEHGLKVALHLVELLDLGGELLVGGAQLGLNVGRALFEARVAHLQVLEDCREARDRIFDAHLGREREGCAAGGGHGVVVGGWGGWGGRSARRSAGIAELPAEVDELEVAFGLALEVRGGRISDQVPVQVCGVLVALERLIGPGKPVRSRR